MKKIFLIWAMLSLLSCSKIDQKVEYKMEATSSQGVMTKASFIQDATHGCSGGSGTTVSCSFVNLGGGKATFETFLPPNSGSIITLKVWKGKNLHYTTIISEPHPTSHEEADIYIKEVIL